MLRKRSVGATHIESIDDSTTPNQIDISVDSFSIRVNGYDQLLPDSVFPGIFKLTRHPMDPSKDQLQWCFSANSRPIEFSADEGTGQKLVKLERVDESKAIATIRKSSGRSTKDADSLIKSVVLDSPDEQTIAAVNDLHRLRSLTLGNVDKSIAEQIAGHPTLDTLVLRCRVTAEVVGELTATLPRLKKLAFGCNDFSAAYGEAIAKSKTLESLTLNNVRHGFDGIPKVQDSSIKSMNLRLCELSTSDLKNFTTHLQRLDTLKLSGCNIVSDDVSSPSTEHELARVEIYSGQIDAGSHSFLRTFPGLKSLVIDGRELIEKPGRRQVGGNF